MCFDVLAKIEPETDEVGKIKMTAARRDHNFHITSVFAQFIPFNRATISSVSFVARRCVLDQFIGWFTVHTQFKTADNEIAEIGKRNIKKNWNSQELVLLNYTQWTSIGRRIEINKNWMLLLRTSLGRSQCGDCVSFVSFYYYFFFCLFFYRIFVFTFASLSASLYPLFWSCCLALSRLRRCDNQKSSLFFVRLALRRRQRNTGSYVSHNKCEDDWY